MRFLFALVLAVFAGSAQADFSHFCRASGPGAAASASECIENAKTVSAAKASTVKKRGRSPASASTEPCVIDVKSSACANVAGSEGNAYWRCSIKSTCQR